MNGFFQIINMDNGTALKIIPQKGKGEPVKIKEITEYLNSRGITYDLSAINNAVTKLADTAVVVQLQESRALPQNEIFHIYLSPDKMSVVIRFYPPSNDGTLQQKDGILKDLASKGICFGIKEEILDAFLQRRRYCRNIEIAAGQPPVQGKDARIEYYFNTDVHAKPAVKEDGSVDFFNLNTINHCTAGDKLAEMFPEEQGECGYNVLGEKLTPRDVKKQRLQYGRDISISEDNTILTADVNGHVSLIENKVFVSDVLEVENVDNATGNIEYEGGVLVNGNVCSNFSVKAKGNVEVRGVVEGAYIEAGGDIIIARGVNGVGKGMLKAGGNIITKFVENAIVSAGGYVESGSILHSKVTSRTEVSVNGRRGFITGGTVTATSKITVKMLGSAMGATTVIEVGVDPEMKMRHQELQKTIIEIDKVMKTIQPVIAAAKQKIAKGVQLNPTQIVHVKTMKQLEKQKSEEMMNCMKEMDEIKEVMDSGDQAQVIVLGEAFPGTRICISDVSIVIKQNYKYCRFVKQQGDVKMVGI